MLCFVRKSPCGLSDSKLIGKPAIIFFLQTSQCMWLMQALGFLLSALPVEDILRNLHSLITPYIQQLEKLADETVRTSINMCQYTHTHTRTKTDQAQLDTGQ